MLKGRSLRAGTLLLYNIHCMSVTPFIENTIKTAGEIVTKGFGHIRSIKQKENQTSVVTEVDLSSEHSIVNAIKNDFPDDTIIAEETGFHQGKSRNCWVIDPIDGTSNFVAGLPWFGVMLAYLQNWEVVASGILLPALNEYYYAEKGKGAYRNDKLISVTSETELTNVLVTYGIDYSEDEKQIKREMILVEKIVQLCRNLRSTNSALDDCFVADGRFGVEINQHSMIWDHTAGYLIVREAGGLYTDIDGRELDFTSDKTNYLRNFTALVAPPALHMQVRKIISEL